MSYDFHLLRLAGGRDPSAEAREFLESTAEAEVLNPGPPDPAKEERKQALAAALRAADPRLEAFPFDYAEIARAEGIPEDEARARYRHIELNGPDEGSGIQIELYDDSATVTVPYWHHGTEAEPVFAEIWRYLSVLEGDGGFRTYDPQLERVLDLGRDRAAVLEAYARGLEVTFAEAKKLIEPRRPWWRFWLLAALAAVLVPIELFTIR